MPRHLWLRSWKAPLPLKGLWVASVVLCIPNLYVWGKSVHALFCKLQNGQGTRTAQDLFKSARWQTVKQLLGDPLPKEAIRSSRVPSDRYGFPLYLPKDLRRTLRENPERTDKAVALFLLSLYLCYTGVRPVKLNSITDASEAEYETEKEYRRLVPTLSLLLGLTEPLRLRAPKLFATNRGGPNGHALLASHLDAVALERSKDTGQWFHKWVCEVYPKTGTQLSRQVTYIAKQVESLGLIGDTKLFLGKIGLKREPVKNRLFAISDYWTQVALRPLHDALMELLRNLPADSTWNQDGGAVTVQKWCEEGRELWSFDLTAATDRFPRTIQASLLDHLLRGYGSGYGQVWSLLLTNRGYRIPGSKTQVCRYAAGQPMGTLSSWAAFALTHHTVVQWAALKCGVQKQFCDYVLLGDDIVIADGAVARSYEVLMSQLGVKINRNKSVHTVGGAEFAKRSFAGAQELTGLHWNLFGLASNSLVHFYTNCVELQRRGFSADWTGILKAVLGPPRDRKVAKPVRSLLLALCELAGPLEDPNVWWAARVASTSQEWYSLTLMPSAIDDGILRAAVHALGLKSLKAERLLLLGRKMRDELVAHLDSILLAQLEDAMVRIEVSSDPGLEMSDSGKAEALRRVRLIPNYRMVMEKLKECHPALLVQWAEERSSVPWTPDPEDLEEFLKDRYALHVAPEQLRVLSRSDSEQLASARDTIQHSVDRLNAAWMRWKYY